MLTASDGQSPGLPSSVPYGLFFCSGFASLTLQVVWFKLLGFVLGSGTFAVSVTVASFFLGLSVGSAVGGRFADRVVRPLRAYGVLELSLALLSLGITLLLLRWADWISALGPVLALDSPLRTPTMAGIAAVVLASPTMLMGATLPFLARYLVRVRSALGERLGMLYGINTLGAAAGSFAVGFLLIAYLGVWGSAVVATAIYASVGVAALVASTREPALDPVATQPGTDAPVEETSRKRFWYLAVFGVSGFTALGYEIVWFRMLTYGGQQSVFSFSGLLTIYLLGLVIGSFLFAWKLSRAPEKFAANFAKLQLLLAAAATLSLAFMGKLWTFSKWLAPLPAALGIPAGAQEFLGWTLSSLLLYFCVLIVPTTLLGVGFPLAGELVVSSLGQLGRRLGVLYSVNTLGGVLGSLATGFVLLPLLGSQWSLIVMMALNLGIFGALFVIEPSLRSDRDVKRAGVLGVAAVAAALLVLGPDYLEKQQTAFTGGATVLDLRETKEATYVVLEYGSGEDRFQQLVVNGESYANNAIAGRRYMAVLAHLPMLLHPAPERALVTCIGTGTTVGALTTWGSLEEIHAVDLSSTVFDFAPYFVPINNSFYEDSRVRPIVADGRHHLLTTDAIFDVLTFEPPPPSDAGVVNLYSEEFYDLARTRTAQGGLLAQWIPFTEPRGDIPRLLLKALLSKYRHVSLWVPSMLEGVAIASDEPLILDEAAIAERMKDPRVAADLAAVGIDSPEDVLAMFVAADDELLEFVADLPELSDDRPRIEYYNLLPGTHVRFDDLVALRRPVDSIMSAPPRDPEKLQRAKEVTEGLWRYHDARVYRDPAAAEAERRRLIATGGNNRYVRKIAQPPP